ncbi:helix-turn-helix transcriptional regulator [Pseudomonas abietaniphila]|jgi:DNA-binding CsgD family transcriptional regulator/PAS domain-containing protein|uniref:Regulatory protein, luxR family n=1 Tax=Pseudomonas abietaniphila TaxID=89065 RepID=A0A1G7RFC6_9PSED|nr:helix-turn-helix transcriptional regulator [Pseudomonas abietaniphila]SDG09344.1 regulatory protein, luxR family [Pseudomonas abietaniphila]
MNELFGDHKRVAAAIASVIDAVGHQDFYAIVLETLGLYIDCERWLAIKYSRFSVPEFIVNTALSHEAVEQYMSHLYRIDPLLRLVTEDRVPSVVTFSLMQNEDDCNVYYDEIFKSGQILDELTLMLPVIGGGYLGFCFDRENRVFNEDEIALFTTLYPIIVAAQAAHMRTEFLEGLGALFGNGKVGVLTLGSDNRMIYQNPAWHALTGHDFGNETLDFILGQPELIAVNVKGLIAHWEYSKPVSACATGIRAVFLEQKSEGYIQTDVNEFFEQFYDAYHLSPRERQLVEKTLRGYSMPVIAEKLDLSLGTVRNYKQRLYAKLDITSEREIFSLFMMHMFGQS